ncbi:MAG: acetyl-CoA C-acetyltransferase [Synergistaceae bacterium]|nr:acetyl-CoA C-acetyltransferase [Synergistaceae bacterium]
MRKVFIAGAVRTPIGKMGGSLCSVPAVDLGEAVIRALLEKTGVPSGSVDHVCMGCVIQAGLGQNPARQSALKAGLPFSTTAETVNLVCGSGLEAVNICAGMIMTGAADIAIAGGMENMSRAPFALTGARFGYRMGSPMFRTEILDTMINDALWDAENHYHMGITAENVAEKWGLSREELDAFAYESQMKAKAAVMDGAFDGEIVSVDSVCSDESPRPNITLEQLAKLRPAFRDEGIVTAGNSSGISDGAAAVMLVCEEKAREFGIEPLAEWSGYAMSGTDPAYMGISPVMSTQKLLRKIGAEIGSIDLFELNEAFAAQALAVKMELGIDSRKLNVHGGAIALGHPVGASGCRILVTLVHALRRYGLSTGVAALCTGGGIGCSAMVITCG